MSAPIPDIHAAILKAKLGSARKDAQIDACEPFAAALHDVLTNIGLKPEVWSAAWIIEGSTRPRWYHAVVRISDQDYDSKGVFTYDRVRKDTKIHKTVKARLVMTKDSPDYEKDDWAEMYRFCFRALEKSFAKPIKNGGTNV